MGIFLERVWVHGGKYKGQLGDNCQDQNMNLGLDSNIISVLNAPVWITVLVMGQNALFLGTAH